MTTFYLIRHGQTTANALGLKQGTINDDRTHLDEIGRKQAQMLHEAFDISFADTLFVSPLARTQETAAILNQTAHLQTIPDDRLLEISYGQWDGRLNQDLLNAYPEVFDPHLKDVLPSYVTIATHGETFDHVQARISDFMYTIAHTRPDASVIVVTHGFTVKAATMVALDLKDSQRLPEPENTSVTKIRLIDNDFYLWYYNRRVGTFFE